MLKRLLFDEDGQTMTEYALIIGLIVLAIFAAFKLFGGKLGALFRKAAGKMEEAAETEY